MINRKKRIPSESLTARKGIKTNSRGVSTDGVDFTSESLTARKGIKTLRIIDVAPLLYRLNH